MLRLTAHHSWYSLGAEWYGSGKHPAIACCTLTLNHTVRRKEFSWDLPPNCPLAEGNLAPIRKKRPNIRAQQEPQTRCAASRHYCLFLVVATTAFSSTRRRQSHSGDAGTLSSPAQTR